MAVRAAARTVDDRAGRDARVAGPVLRAGVRLLEGSAARPPGRVAAADSHRQPDDGAEKRSRILRPFRAGTRCVRPKNVRAAAKVPRNAHGTHSGRRMSGGEKPHPRHRALRCGGGNVFLRVAGLHHRRALLARSAGTAGVQLSARHDLCGHVVTPVRSAAEFSRERSYLAPTAVSPISLGWNRIMAAVPRIFRRAGPS